MNERKSELSVLRTADSIVLLNDVRCLLTMLYLFICCVDHASQNLKIVLASQHQTVWELLALNVRCQTTKRVIFKMLYLTFHFLMKSPSSMS